MKNIINASVASLLGSALLAFAAPVVLDDVTFPEITGNATDDTVITITSDLDLSTNVNKSTTDEYILDGITIVESGVTLTLPAGAVVRGQPLADIDASGNVGTPAGTLLVSRGGALVAEGTSSDPIIFTTAMDTGRERWSTGETFLDAAPKTNPLDPVTIGSGSAANPEFENNSLWGAVTLLGYAPTNRGIGDTGIAGEAFIEGFGGTTEPYTYGGNLPNDSSGSLSYVSIRHSGQTIVEGDEQQGLTLGGVGAGTNIDHLEVYCSGDDGIEIFGGTVNIRNILISNVDDDALDLDQGWTGNAQFVFLIGTDNPVTNADTDSIGEWDGMDGDSGTTAEIEAAIQLLNDNPGSAGAATALQNLRGGGSTTVSGTPFMAPTIYNLTSFGYVASHTFEIDSGFGGAIYNSIFQGIPVNGIDIEDETSADSILSGFGSSSPVARIQNGGFLIANNTFVGQSGVTATSAQSSSVIDIFAANGTYPGVADNDFVAGGSNPLNFGGNNAARPSSAQFGDTDTFISPVPAATAGLTGAANTTPVSGAFFTTAEYRGAFNPFSVAPHWTTGWTALNIDNILEDSIFGDL